MFVFKVAGYVTTYNESNSHVGTLKIFVLTDRNRQVERRQQL